MSLKDNLDLSLLINATETWVLDILEEELVLYPDLYRSEEAVLDIMALALNQVKPHYYVTLLGNLYAHAPSEEHLATLREATRAAIAKVATEEPGL